MQHPIFLIGYRGTGKTTVGRLLAERLGCESIDADDEIERRAGKSIAAIFADDGEAAFRDLEAAVVAELCRRTQTRRRARRRGGAPRRQPRRDARGRAGRLAHRRASTRSPRASPPTTPPASRRPNLTAAGGRAEIEALLAERTPIYRACATFVVDTEGKSPAEVADEIVAQLRASSQHRVTDRRPCCRSSCDWQRCSSWARFSARSSIGPIYTLGLELAADLAVVARAAGCAPRSWFDRMPVLRLAAAEAAKRRFTALGSGCGRCCWKLASASALAALYWWEIERART